MTAHRFKHLFRKLVCGAAFATYLLAQTLYAQSDNHPLPWLAHKDGRYALMVDGAPFLMLGAQVNNSSAWPALLPKVWPAIEFLHANTVEMPVYWEQLEPEAGRFDYTVLDTLLAQAREHHVRLVPLWFGTWKNGSQHYMPEWMKLAPEKYPHMVDKNGGAVDSPSPYATASVEADERAFTAFLRHLKATDPQRTVIMVQVENEPGTWGSLRDYSPAAQNLFEAPVPPEVLAAMHVQAAASASWQEVFGPEAEVCFHAWSVAKYVGQVAAAGKAVYPLPMYVNAALRDPIKPGAPGSYESGGPTDNVIPIWKAAAPSVDLLAPDIYMSQSAAYLKVLDLYQRPDNALFVPETANQPEYARYFFAALGHQAIGFSPFGIDYTRYANAPLGATRVNEETLAPFALIYQLIGPMDREIARLNFAGKLQAIAEEKGRPRQSLPCGAWEITVTYGLLQFGPGNNPPGNHEPTGGALIAQFRENEFLVTGLFCRVDFRPADAASGKQRQFLRVEEGSYQNGAFKPSRLWNGDQTDWGLNFTSVPQVLRVSLGVF